MKSIVRPLGKDLDSVTDADLRVNNSRTDWWKVCRECRLSTDQMRKYQDRLDWGQVSQFQEFDLEFLRRFQHLFNWYIISRRLVAVGDDFLQEFKDYIAFHEFSSNEEAINSISTEALEDQRFDFSWDNISAKRRMSEEEIIRFGHLINWDLIRLWNTKISPERLCELRAMFEVHLDR